MKLTQIATNVTLVSLNSGVEVLFSYFTPVAVYTPGVGYVRTRTKFSATTSRHISSWLGNREADSVDQEVIDHMVGSV